MRHLYLELLLSDHNSFCTPPCRDACPTHIKIPQFLDYIAHQDYKNGVRKLREDLPFPAHPRPRLPAALRGSVPPAARRAPDHHLLAAPLHGRPVHRRRADRRAAAAGRAQARHGQAHRHRRRRPGRSGRRLLRPTRGPRRQDLRGPAQAGRHAALRHPELPPAARPHREGAQRALAPGRRAAVRRAPRRRLPARGPPRRRSSTPSSSPWAPSTPTRWASPARTPTASSPRSTSSASSSSPATCTSARRSPSSAAASPPWTPVAPRCARAPKRSPASTAARARRCPPTTPRSTRPRRRASSSSCSCAPVRVVTDAANKVTGIEMQRMELGEPDASGRRRPVPIEGSEFVVECDQVITAIGQYPKLDGTSEEQGVKRTKWRTIAGRRLHLPDRRPARLRRRRRACSARRP